MLIQGYHNQVNEGKGSEASLNTSISRTGKIVSERDANKQGRAA